MRIRFEPRPRKVLALLLAATAVLTAFSLCGVYLKHVKGDLMFYRFVPLFDLDREGNIPNWFSAILFASSASLAWAIASARAAAGDRTHRLWRALAVGFVLASIDDAAAIHEGYVDDLRSIFHAGGLFYFTWVIPALALLAVITPLFLRLRISLPAPRRTILAAAAILIIGGAVGMEMLAGGYVDVHGYKTLTYSLLANLEETMELVGQVLLVYGLLLIVRDEPERA